MNLNQIDGKLSSSLFEIHCYNKVMCIGYIHARELYRDGVVRGKGKETFFNLNLGHFSAAYRTIKWISGKYVYMH